MYVLFGRLRHSPIPRLSAVMLVALVAMAWGGLAFCGEIHSAAEQGDLKKVKVLLKGNPHLVFSKDADGRTPLHLAATRDVAALLLTNKADVNAKDNKGWTPLHVVSQYGSKDMADLLLTHKAEVNDKTDDGRTPLRLAADYGHKDVADWLRQHDGHE